jgi:hypothetical protein
MKNVFYHYFSHRMNILYWIVVLALSGLSFSTSAISTYWPTVSLLLLAPWFEWVIHKYLLHNRPQSSNGAWQHYFDQIHFYHHQNPRNIPYVFAPFPIPFFIPTVFFLIFSLAFWDLKAGLMTAFWTFLYYMYYEWIHLAHHLDDYKPLTKRGRELKQAHQWHHFKNENYWWGVTSNLGDKTLGTWMSARDVEKSPTVKTFSS